MFDDYVRRWNLHPDGDAIITRGSRLLPVRRDGEPAMLKVAAEEDERAGGALMTWWAGDGAARVLAYDGDAVLLERAIGLASLAEMARDGRDDEACQILCGVAGRLHAPKAAPLPTLTPLAQWFRALAPAAAAQGGILTRCAEAASTLLAEPRDTSVLHGDLHHGNVLDFGLRGWLAIDPKCLAGERCFEFANIFTNPDLAVANAPGRFARRLTVVAGAAGLERQRLLRWIVAWAGLAATWLLQDGEPATVPRQIAELATAELDR